MRGGAEGVGLVAAVFTPFGADGEVDLGPIERQAEVLVRDKVRGAFVCGTSGEGASLTVAERLAIARRWCEVAGDALEVIVHIGHTSLPEAQALAADAEQAGATAIAAVPPYYFRPASLPPLVDFCGRLAAAAPGLPFFYYHIPTLTHVRLPMAPFMEQAAAAIPTFAGLKFTAEDLAEYARCLTLAGDRHEVFLGRDETLLAGLGLGARSAVGTTYNVAAPLYHRMAAAFGRGDLGTARGLQDAANRMIEVGIEAGGLPAFKAMMAWSDVDCGPCRPPLPTLDAGQAAALRGALERAGFFEAVAEARDATAVAAP